MNRPEEKSLSIKSLMIDLNKFGKDSEIQRRAYLIHFTLTVGILVVLIFGIVAMFEKDYSLATVDMVTILFTTGVLIHFHKVKSVEITGFLCVALTATFFFWLLIYGGVKGTAFVWYYTFPLFSVFIIGSKRGTFIAIAAGIAAAVFFLISHKFPNLEQYNHDFQWRFLFSYAVVVLFAFLSDHYREASHRSLQHAHDDLEKKVSERTSELLKKNAELEKASITDALTGMKNRMKLDDILSYELKKVRRYGGELGVIIVDLDKFKNINDTFGHIAGDTVLIEFSKIIERNIRATDSAGRWGGEEFLIVCPSAGGGNCLELAEKLRAKVCEASIPVVGGVTASFGATCYVIGDTINTIIKRADDALYEAKKDRNSCSLIEG